MATKATDTKVMNDETDFKTKYEELEKCYNNITQENINIKKEYEELEIKYDKLKKEYDEFIRIEFGS